MKWCCLFPFSLIFYSTLGLYTTKQKQKEFVEIYNKDINFIETIEIIHDMGINILLYNVYEYVKGLIKINKNMYKLDFYHNNVQYSIPIILKKGRKPYINKIIGIKDDVSIDISDEIGKYLGPNIDFYNQPVTPNLFGYNKILIYVDDVEKIFENEQVIKI